MAGISDVAYIPYFITLVSEVTVYDIECDIRPCMPKVAFAFNGWPAHIHAHMAGCDGREQFF